MRSYLFLSLLILSCQLCPGQPNSKQTKTISGLQKELTDDLKKDNLHGSVSAAIVDRGRLIWAGAYGYASSEKDIPADTNTIYRICSITKMFTVTLLMQLVEEGKVKLDDFAETYVPEVRLLPGYNKQMRFTLQQLASHTSGLDREPQGIPDVNVGPVDKWEEKVLALIPHASFHSSPGEQFLYSNVGFALLGLALERAAGKPYVQLVQDRIFTPLNMNNSFFAVPGDKREQLAQGIEHRAGIINTQTMIGHDGSDPGYTSQLSIEPNIGSAVILLRNCRPGTTDLISATRDVLRRL